MPDQDAGTPEPHDAPPHGEAGTPPGYPGAQPGYPTAPQAHEGAPQGYPTAPEGYPGAAPQGYPGAPQGHPGAAPQGYAPQGYAPQRYVPPAPLSPSDERTWGMLAHLSAFIAGFFGLAFLGPLIVFLVYKDRSAFVRRHATESLNFQISLMIYTAVAVVLALVTLGFGLLLIVPLGIVAVIAALVFMIQASIAGNAGREYRYPLTIRLVH